jgi:hypothetical protein
VGEADLFSAFEVVEDSFEGQMLGTVREAVLSDDGETGVDEQRPDLLATSPRSSGHLSNRRLVHHVHYLTPVPRANGSNALNTAKNFSGTARLVATKRSAMDCLINARDLRETTTEDLPSQALEAGQVRLTLDRFGLSANNITYAVMGDLMSYWNFFPYAGHLGSQWRRLPVWGFATAAESASEAVHVGERFFGYFPWSTELIVTPGRADATGFSDMASHRAALPHVYNRYAKTATDQLYSEAGEELLMLLRPLFTTSFVVVDFFVDHSRFGAEVAVVSSASSKTAIGSALLLAELEGLEVVGLTSAKNVEFCERLGCYDTVLTYDEIDQLERRSAVYFDVAGRRDVTANVHRHFGDLLGWSMIIGDTHWDAPETANEHLPGPKPELLFAPVQIAKRRTDWGREGFEEAVGAAWERCLPVFAQFLEIEHLSGVDAMRSRYVELVDGNVDPTVGMICSFTTS